MNFSRLSYLIASLYTLAAGLAHAEATISVIPEHPLQNEAIYVRVQASGQLNSSTFYRYLSYVVSSQAADFRVVADGSDWPPDGDPVDHIFYLGRLPIGTYTIDVAPTEEASDGLATTSFEVSLPAAVVGPGSERRAVSPGDYSGMWYDPEAPGTAVVLEQSPATRKLGGGIYLYENGQPIWYLLSPVDWITPAMYSYEFDLFRTRGSDYRLGYKPEQSGATKVGNATAEFLDHQTMKLTFTIAESSQVRVFKRFKF